MMKVAIKVVSLLLLVLALLASCHTQKVTSSDEEEGVLGLALGGGGAKAATEVGVLMALDDSPFSVDYIAGSSMGAFVGGLYAAGYTGKEIRDMWLNEDWIKLFDQHAIASAKDDKSDIKRTIFGVVDGDDFENMLRDRLKKDKKCVTFEEMKDIKFCCTATEIIDDSRLKDTVLSNGDLASAIRASLSYPAPIVGLSHVYIDGKELVDGGMLNNLPVDVVKKMGAKHVIAVDLETKHTTVSPIFKIGMQFLMSTNNRIRSIVKFTKTEWLVRWLADGKAIQQRHDRNWQIADVRISPKSQLVHYSILSFDRASIEQMISAGQEAMKGQLYKVEDLIK